MWQSSTNGEAVKKVNQFNETELRLDCHGANAPRNDEEGGNNDDKPKRQPNFDPKILQKFVSGVGLRFVSDHEGDDESVIASEASPTSTNGRQSVIPAKAGIQNDQRLDSRLRGSDEGGEWGNGEALKNGRQSVIPAKAGRWIHI